MPVKINTLFLVGCATLLFLACILAGCSSSNVVPSTTPPAVQNVMITDSGFIPASIVIKAGTTVNWTSNSQYPHSVDSNFGKESDRFNSPTIYNGGSYQHTYNEPGNYAYFDGRNHANTGTVKVV